MANWINLHGNPNGKPAVGSNPHSETIVEDSVIDFLERHDQSEVGIMFNDKPVLVKVISASVFFQMARLQFPGDESPQSFDFKNGNHGISLIQE